VNEVEDLTDKYSSICGFNNGWKLSSDIVEMPNSDIVKSIRNNIFNISTEFNDDALETFKHLYEMTEIKYKEIIVAYGLVAPFLYDLSKYYSLIPHLHLIGKSNSGKTSMARLITNKFYGHVKSIYSLGTSFPNLSAVISSSTFPICLDEIENLGMNYKNKDEQIFLINLKSFTTAPVDYQKMNQDTTLKVQIPMQAPIVSTCNYRPLILNDIPYSKRCIVLEVPETTKSNQNNWKNTYNYLEDGFMVGLLYDFMEQHSIEDLIKNSEEQLNSFTRQDTIIKILNIGKYIAKEVLGLDLKINFGDILNNSIMESEILDLVRIQCLTNDGNKDMAANWVKNKVYMAKTKDYDEYRYTESNLDDLNKLGKNLTLSKLSDILMDRWAEVKGKSQQRCGANGRVMCIRIPIQYINEDNEAIEVSNLNCRFPNLEHVIKDNRLINDE
jgi:hypothetical protein